MANSIQQAKIAATPSEKVKTNELAGRVRVAFAEYEASAEQSTIHMFSLPNGARILGGRLAHDALGSSTTLAVGHNEYIDSSGSTVAADADEFKAAASSASAGAANVASTIALGENSVVNADKDGIPVSVTLAGANGTGTIQLHMTYVVD
jgi:hypothetical protein|tara:strand:- start:252 stop:701 length:450 start_codon:yes stop_codon:yes gene_type:complete